MERKRTILWDDPEQNKREALTALAGVEYLQAIKSGAISPAPVAKLIGYRILDVDDGLAVIEQIQ
jgi:hypothetical protein